MNFSLGSITYLNDFNMLIEELRKASAETSKKVGFFLKLKNFKKGFEDF